MSRPETTVRIAFDLAAGGAGNFFTLDDPVKGVLDGPVRTNLVPNPSFETNTTGWFSLNGSTISRDTTQAYIGSASIKVINSASNNSGIESSTSPAATAGQTYTLSAYVKADSGSIATLNCFVIWLNSGGAEISRITSQLLTATTAWQRISVTGVVPSNTVSADLRISRQSGLSGTIWYCDAIIFEQTSQLLPYFDGGILDQSGVSYSLAWTGTANSSTSTATPNAGLGLAGDILEDVTAEVQKVTVRRGRSRELERYQAGAATVDLDNSQRKYDPAAGTAITPYGASMRPRKAVSVSTAGLPIFNGIVEDWNLDYSLDGDHVASVKVTDGFVFLANQDIEPHTTTAQATGARVSAILDRSEIDWPAGKRDIDTGVATLQADAIGGTANPRPVNALQYLQKVDEAEQGALYIGANGSLIFRDRSSLQILTSVKFADDGTGIPYTAIDASYGSEELRNRITVARLNGGTATAVGTASVESYGAIDYEIRDSLLADDTQAQDLADQILARYEEPLLRIDSIEVVLNTLTAQEQLDVLGLELGALVQVVYTPSGIGDPIDQFVRLDQIEHNIDPAQHRVTLSFSQGEAPALVLDSALFGILDTNTLGF